MGKIFNFFSGSNNKSGKGVSKKQVEFDKKLGFGFFFRLLKMRLGKFSGSNLIFALCNIVIFIALFGLTGTFDSSAPSTASPLYAQVSNMAMNDSAPGIISLFNMHCAPVDVRVVSTASSIMMNSIYALIITFGLSSIGMVYNMRNICTGEHVETWSDFFYSIRRNFKQGIVIALIDGIVLFLLMYDILIYGSSQGNSFMHIVFFYAILLITVIYYIMRFYIYLQLVSCEMKIGKMFKNAFLLTSLGLKRNLMILLATITVVIVFAYLLLLMPQAAIVLFCMFLCTLYCVHVLLVQIKY